MRDRQKTESGVFLLPAGKDLTSPIGRAIIHGQDLEIFKCLGGYGLERLLEGFFPVITGHQYRDLWHGSIVQENSNLRASKTIKLPGEKLAAW